MPKKLYIGTQNDGLFIIDQPPRPSHDDMADCPGVNVIAKFYDSGPGTDALAEALVAAYNATLS